MNTKIEEMLKSEDIELKRLGATLLEQEEKDIHSLTIILNHCIKPPFSYRILPDIYSDSLGIMINDPVKYDFGVNTGSAFIKDPTKLLKLVPCK